MLLTMCKPSYVVETRQQIAIHLKKSFEFACQKLGLCPEEITMPDIPQLAQRKLSFLDSAPTRFLEIILTETANCGVYCRIELDKLCQTLEETPQLMDEKEDDFVRLNIKALLLCEMTSYIGLQIRAIYQEIDRTFQIKPHKIKDSRMPWEKLWG